jgi:hypothetical protein
MQEGLTQRGLLAPDEGMARERCLAKGVGVPDLVPLEDFLILGLYNVR